MTNLKQASAAPADPPPLIDVSSRPSAYPLAQPSEKERGTRTKPPLPEDMQGWLSTHEAAALMQMPDRSFRDYAARHHLPKRAVGVPVYYSPDVIAAAVKEKNLLRSAPAVPKAAAKETSSKETAAKNAAAKSVAVPVAGADFHSQALAAIVLVVQKQSLAQR